MLASVSPSSNQAVENGIRKLYQGGQSKIKLYQKTQVGHLRFDSRSRHSSIQRTSTQAQPEPRYLSHLLRRDPEHQARNARWMAGGESRRCQWRLQEFGDPWRRTLHAGLGCVWARETRKGCGVKRPIEKERQGRSAQRQASVTWSNRKRAEETPSPQHGRRACASFWRLSSWGSALVTRLPRHSLPTTPKARTPSPYASAPDIVTPSNPVGLCEMVFKCLPARLRPHFLTLR